MTTGIDIPRATVFLNLLPTANGPSYYQEFCRVRTPNGGKDKAFIIDFVDDHPIAVACSKTRRKVYEKEGFKING
jgi:superfamily II DNA or RNA helicase